MSTLLPNTALMGQLHQLCTVFHSFIENPEIKQQFQIEFRDRKTHEKATHFPPLCVSLNPKAKVQLLYGPQNMTP